MVTAWIEWLLFGGAGFEEDEEYRAFQYRFLIVVMVAAGLATAVLLAGALTQVNRIASPHLQAMAGFTALSALLWLALRGRPRAFRPVAHAYLIACQLEYVSALVFVPEDEMRILWFVTNVPGVCLLLGQRVGALVTGLTVLGLALGNRHLQAPYSTHALATLLVGLVYLAVFFHSYANQSLSYFKRMRELNRRLREAATRDPLTGLLNARAYREGSEQALAQAQRAGQPRAVLFVDLDHFKAVNDCHGHAAGDEVLRRVAGQLRSRVRRSDFVGRIGGEEFSLFLPGASLSDALRVAEQLRSGIEALAIDIGDGKTLRVTASIGVAGADRPGDSVGELHRHADAAMYRAKAAGRNRVSQLDSAALRPG